jgi:hypothetical protein
LAARSTIIRAPDGKKIAFINGTKFKSLTSSKRQVALFAEARAAAVLSECIFNAKKNDQTDSAIRTVMINAKKVAFASKRRIIEASMAKGDAVLKHLVDDHIECQLLINQFMTFQLILIQQLTLLMEKQQ